MSARDYDSSYELFAEPRGASPQAPVDTLQLDDPAFAESDTRAQQRADACGRDVIERVDETLDRLAGLAELLDAADDFVVPPFDVELPAHFKLSIVMPVYNEEATIREIIARVLRLPLPIELVVVDDCSTDRTRNALAEILQAIDDEVDIRIFHKLTNEGKGAALRTGFAHATGNVVIVQDADLEYDPRDILEVIRPILHGDSDVVYGSRFLETDRHANSSWVHRLGNGTLTWASNRATGFKLTDMETCYKAFRADVIKDITIRQNRFGFEPEITAKLARRGHRIVEVPISYNARDFSEGKKINIKDGFNALYCIARYALAD